MGLYLPLVCTLIGCSLCTISIPIQIDVDVDFNQNATPDMKPLPESKFEDIWEIGDLNALYRIDVGIRPFVDFPLGEGLTVKKAILDTGSPYIVACVEIEADTWQCQDGESLSPTSIKKYGVKSIGQPFCTVNVSSCPELCGMNLTYAGNNKDGLLKIEACLYSVNNVSFSTIGWVNRRRTNSLVGIAPFTSPLSTVSSFQMRSVVLLFNDCSSKNKKSKGQMLINSELSSLIAWDVQTSMVNNSNNTGVMVSNALFRVNGDKVELGETLLDTGAIISSLDSATFRDFGNAVLSNIPSHIRDNWLSPTCNISHFILHGCSYRRTLKFPQDPKWVFNFSIGQGPKQGNISISVNELLSWYQSRPYQYPWNVYWPFEVSKLSTTVISFGILHQLNMFIDYDRGSVSLGKCSKPPSHTTGAVVGGVAGGVVIVVIIIVAVVVYFVKRRLVIY